jgi:ribosomal protein L37AE/L43A
MDPLFWCLLFAWLWLRTRRREKDCPECGERVARKARACRFCGHAFVPAGARPLHSADVLPFRRG